MRDKFRLRLSDDFRRATADQYWDTGQKNKVIKITNIEAILSYFKTSKSDQ